LQVEFPVRLTLTAKLTVGGSGLGGAGRGRSTEVGTGQ